MKQIIETAQAPKAIGPYSQAVRVGPHLYCAGQIGLDPTTGLLVPGGIVPQTQQVLRNIAAVFEAAGGTLPDIVNLQIFLTDLEAQYEALNTVMSSFFATPYPARAAVAVSALPKGALVEIVADGFLEWE